MTQCDDKKIVRRNASIQKGNRWAEWMAHEHSPLFDLLTKHSPDLESCKNTLLPWIESIVTSLHRTHHTSRPTEASKEKTQIELTKFLEYLSEHDEWQGLSAQPLTPPQPSLPFFLQLSRAYLRFKQLHAKKNQRTSETTKDGQNNDVAATVSNSLMGAVNDLVSAIDSTDQKLSFQMYMDGLVEAEIAALLNLEIAQVRLFIEKSKIDLKTDIEESDFGT